MLAKDFYISNHHLKVPNYYKTAEGFLLGRWIERQRTAYHQKNNYKNLYKIISAILIVSHKLS
ncbi:MAG: helicase associated domain-containing protein [Clostridiales bacterium]|nr:helicase associated domain-containing protein [Clostridiales bacterium]